MNTKKKLVFAIISFSVLSFFLSLKILDRSTTLERNTNRKIDEYFPPYLLYSSKTVSFHDFSDQNYKQIIQNTQEQNSSCIFFITKQKQAELLLKYEGIWAVNVVDKNKYLKENFQSFVYKNEEKSMNSLSKLKLKKKMSFLHQHSSTNKTITWLKYLKQFLPSEKKLNSDFIIHTFTVENNNITTGCFKECRDTLIHHTKFLNKYFSSIQIIITPLSAQENTYPKAPFHMMRKIMTNETFQDTYTHFMMIEHDTFPIRNFWAQQAEHLVYNSLSNFNVFGSAVRCFSCNVASYDMFQLNGNSIYSLQNKNYIQFFDKSQFLFGYDVEIYHKTLLELPWKNHQSLTIFSLFLQNSYIDQIDEIEFPKQYPETYFIHSKAKFNATKFQKDDHFFKPNKNQVKIVFFVMDMNIEILKNLIKYTPCGKRQMNVDLWISSKCNGLCKSLQKIQNCFGDVILRQVEKEFEDPYKNTFHQFMYNREINETYTHAFIYSDKIKPVQKFWLQKLVLLVENVSPSVGMIIPGKRDHSCNLPLVHFSRHGIFKIEKLEEYFSIIVPQDPVFGRFYNSTKLSDDSTTEQSLIRNFWLKHFRRVHEILYHDLIFEMCDSTGKRKMKNSENTYFLLKAE